MRKSALALSIATLLGACVTTQSHEPVQTISQDKNGIVLRGLIDATRKTPPERYDHLAAEHCSKSGSTATFTGMEQRSTFAFDVTYRCVNIF